MSANLPPAPLRPGDGPAGTSRPKRRSKLLIAFGVLLGLVLVVCATVAITIWYLQRPIKPVVLSPAEKAAVETKLQRVASSGAPAQSASRSAGGASASSPEPDRPYAPGSKVLRLSERELNGLLNANTELGKTVRLELGRDAINAYVVAPIPQDFPIMGGKVFRARGRFRMAVTNGAPPYAILEDVTVFGLSLPREWLGGIKGKNLLADAMGERHGMPVLSGVKSLRIEPGALVLEVND